MSSTSTSVHLHFNTGNMFLPGMCVETIFTYVFIFIYTFGHLVEDFNLIDTYLRKVM